MDGSSPRSFCTVQSSVVYEAGYFPSTMPADWKKLLWNWCHGSPRWKGKRRESYTSTWLGTGLAQRLRVRVGSRGLASCGVEEGGVDAR